MLFVNANERWLRYKMSRCWLVQSYTCRLKATYSTKLSLLVALLSSCASSSVLVAASAVDTG